MLSKVDIINMSCSQYCGHQTALWMDIGSMQGSIIASVTVLISHPYPSGSPEILIVADVLGAPWVRTLNLLCKPEMGVSEKQGHLALGIH